MNVKRNSILFSFVCFTALALAACSGLPSGGGGGGGGGGGTGTLNLTVIDTPPAGASVLSFQVTITQISLTPSTGSPVNLSLSPAPVVELARLQSDSAFLGSFSVASGSYTGMTVALSSPDVIIANETGAALNGAVGGSCPDLSVCEFKPVAASAVPVTFTSAVTVSSTVPQGLALDFNSNNMITFTGGTLSVDFSQADALTAVSLPRTGEPSGTSDLIEDFTGVLTSVTGSGTTKTIQIESPTRGTITATANSSTVYDTDPSGTICVARDSTCLIQDQTVSVDVALNASGTLTLVEFEPLVSAPPVDLIEGVVSSVSAADSTQFQLVLSEKVLAATGSLISGLNTGDPVRVTIGSSPVFFVDLKDLTGNSSLPTAPLDAFRSATNNSVIFPGQTVLVEVTAFTAAGGGAIAAATVDAVGLRWSRISGTVSGPPTLPADFNIAGLPAYIPEGVPANPGIPSLVTPTRVQTFATAPGVTVFDGVSDLSGLVDTDRVSIRALYLGPATTPAFLAEKVRKH